MLKLIGETALVFVAVGLLTDDYAWAFAWAGGTFWGVILERYIKKGK